MALRSRLLTRVQRTGSSRGRLTRRLETRVWFQYPLPLTEAAPPNRDEAGGMEHLSHDARGPWARGGHPACVQMLSLRIPPVPPHLNPSARPARQANRIPSCHTIPRAPRSIEFTCMRSRRADSALLQAHVLRHDHGQRQVVEPAHAPPLAPSRNILPACKHAEARVKSSTAELA